WEPTSTFSVLGNIHSRTFDGTAPQFRANILSPGSNDLNGNFDRETVFYDGGDNNPQEYDSTGGSVVVTWDLPAFTLSSITGYEGTNGRSRGDIDGGNMVTGPGFIPFPSDTQDSIDFLDQYTQEFRIASNTQGPFDWQTGAYLFNSAFKVTTQ